MNNPTRRQHTVWRQYLRAWAHKDAIWCGMSHKAFPTGLMVVGQEKDFYRIREMTDADVAMLRAAFISPLSSPRLREAAEGWIGVFDRVRLMRRSLEEQGHDALSLLRPTYIEGEEKLHAEIERNAIPLLKRLLASDEFPITDDAEYGIFAHYLMTQYFRTTRMFANLRRGLEDRFPGLVERTMGPLRHIMATAAGGTLVASRSTMIAKLVANDTDVALITGDQPVINLLAVDLPVEQEVEDCEFYYPLSPSKALFIATHDRFPEGRIAHADVARDLNRKMAVSAERQIFAAKMSDLKDVLEFVGKHHEGA